MNEDWDKKNVSKEEEKESLIKEIKNVIQKKNNYKNASINLLSFLNQMDPIYIEIIELIKEHQMCLLKIKKEKI